MDLPTLKVEGVKNEIQDEEAVQAAKIKTEEDSAEHFEMENLSKLFELNEEKDVGGLKVEEVKE